MVEGGLFELWAVDEDELAELGVVPVEEPPVVGPRNNRSKRLKKCVLRTILATSAEWTIVLRYPNTFNRSFNAVIVAGLAAEVAVGGEDNTICRCNAL